MTQAVNVNRPDFLAISAASWGPEVPEWVGVLAAECNRTTQAAAAKRIGYAGAVVSQLLRAKYPGDIDKVEASVRGALMGETVICPVLDEIGRDWCLTQQSLPRTGASAVRARIWNACRSGCPHSRIKGADDAAL